MLEEGAAESLTYVTSLAVWPTNYCPGRQFTSSYNLYNLLTYSGLLYLREPAILPEPMILQIQDNGNDLEEEGGDHFVGIDDMLNLPHVVTLSQALLIAHKSM